MPRAVTELLGALNDKTDKRKSPATTNGGWALEIGVLVRLGCRETRLDPVGSGHSEAVDAGGD